MGMFAHLETAFAGRRNQVVDSRASRGQRPEDPNHNVAEV